MLSQQTGRRLWRGLVSPEPYVLVQLLTKRLRPSGRVFGAEVGAKAVGGGSRGRLCAALGVRLLGVQVFLREVGVRFGKPLEVGWKDKGTLVTGLWGQRSRVRGLSLAPHSHPGGVVASTWTLGRPREAPHLSFLCEDQGGSHILSATPALGKLKGQVRDVFCVLTSWQWPHTPEAGASMDTARPWGHQVHRESPRAIVGPVCLLVALGHGVGVGSALGLTLGHPGGSVRLRGPGPGHCKLQRLQGNACSRWERSCLHGEPVVGQGSEPQRNTRSPGGAAPFSADTRAHPDQRAAAPA